MLHTCKQFRYEPSYKIETGTIVYYAVYVPLRDQSGVITGIPGAARDVLEARASIGRYLGFCNSRRLHSSLDGKTPDQDYSSQPAPDAVAV